MPHNDDLRIPSVQETILATHEELLSELRALREATEQIEQREIPAPIVHVAAPEVTVNPAKVTLPEQEGPERVLLAIGRLEIAVREAQKASPATPPTASLSDGHKELLEAIRSEIKGLSGDGKGTGERRLIRGGGSNILGFVSTADPVYADQTNQKLSLTTDGKLRVDAGVVQTTSTSYIIQLDEASATITYVGEADPASSTASAVWRIKRLDSTSGLIVLYAGGAATFNQIWNNRAALSYS